MSTTLDVSVLKKSKAFSVIDIPDGLRVLEDNEQPQKGFHTFRILTPQDGDKRIVWDSRDLRQINEAKDTFNKLIREGLVPYKVGVDGKATSEVMAEFDPSAEEVIFLPAVNSGLIVGG